MQNIKRKQNAIIINFTLYLIGLIIILSIYLFKVYPSYSEVADLKNETSVIYNELKKTETTGLNLNEFKSTINLVDNEVNLFHRNIINDFSPNFYNQYFINNDGGDYLEYLDGLLDNYSSNQDLDESVSLLSNILPVYSNINVSSDSGSEILNEYVKNNELLSDFKFINYIERLFHTFNLSYNNSIGIDNLVLLEDYSIGEGASPLETNIYYIPLSLDISGTKELLLDFIYFIENVGNISIEGGELSVNNTISNDFSSLRNKVIIGDQRNSNYNIFNNIITDIYKISFQKYIDSSFNLNNDRSFIDYLKTNQGRERINMRMELRFYVKGFPSYIIENYINDFIIKFNDVQNQIKQEMGKQSNSILKSEQLATIDTTLSQLRVGLIQNLQKSLATKVDIDKSYNEAYKYNLILDEYLEKINN